MPPDPRPDPLSPAPPPPDPATDPAPRAIPPAEALLHWYDRHRRRMPWRALPGEAPDPYRVWLSEIMLQQTTVAAVIPYFERFIARFPSVRALAEADEAEVMAAWAGLGYYARARNLHACARRVAAMGGFPRDLDGLRALPGIGPYTAAAVASIAFGVPAVPVDGNVERVASRVFAVADPLPGARPAIAAAAARLGEQEAARARPADFTQALFDLGATVCTPGTPACALCPWFEPCEARRRGIAPELPRKAPKAARPVRFGAHFWLTDAAGRVLLRRRPPRGLLGGMLELPGTAWRAEPWGREEALSHAPMPAAWHLAGRAEHGFTHFELRMDVYAAQVPAIAADGMLREASALDGEALPTVMRRCVRVAQAAAVAVAADAGPTAGRGVPRGASRDEAGALGDLDPAAPAGDAPPSRGDPPGGHRRNRHEAGRDAARPARGHGAGSLQGLSEQD